LTKKKVEAAMMKGAVFMKIFAPLILILILICANAHAFSVGELNALKQTNDLQGMRNYALAWTKAEPANGSAWYGLGMADYASDNDAEAIVSFTRAIQLSPNETVFYNNLAAAYAHQGHVQSALVILDKEEPAARKANDAYVWYVLGNAYLKIKAARDAAAIYANALALRANYGACWTNLGVALEMTGDTQGAMAAYQHGKALGNELGGHNAAYLQQEIAQAAADAARYKALTSPAHMANVYYRLQQMNAVPGHH
jgi:tetratricopeptide (TPR) repeat protein